MEKNVVVLDLEKYDRLMKNKVLMKAHSIYIDHWGRFLTDEDAVEELTKTLNIFKEKYGDACELITELSNENERLRRINFWRFLF